MLCRTISHDNVITNNVQMAYVRNGHVSGLLYPTIVNYKQPKILLQVAFSPAHATCHSDPVDEVYDVTRYTASPAVLILVHLRGESYKSMGRCVVAAGGVHYLASAFIPGTNTPLAELYALQWEASIRIDRTTFYMDAETKDLTKAEIW